MPKGQKPYRAPPNLYQMCDNQKLLETGLKKHPFLLTDSQRARRGVPEIPKNALLGCIRKGAGKPSSLQFKDI